MSKMLSIIIPVYNASKTLDYPINSLICQSSKDKCELIFVNDGSEDNSLEILLKYKEELELIGYAVVIHSHDSNQGVASARNSGLSIATGNYIYYLDSDDFLESNAVEMIVNNIVTESADIIYCNWYLAFRKKKREMFQPKFSTNWDAIELLLTGALRWNLWLFVVKRLIYDQHNIGFEPKMNMGEDLMVTAKLLIHCKTISKIDSPLYNYSQINDDSLTRNYSNKNIEEVTWNLLEVERYLQNSKYSSRIGNQIQFLKLNIKLPLLISNNISNYLKWKSWFPEANIYIYQNKNIPLRIRLLQFMAVKSQFWLIKLHYYFVIRIVYGYFYK